MLSCAAANSQQPTQLCVGASNTIGVNCEVSRKWNQQRAGMKLAKAHYCSVFMDAWKKTATVERAKDVFRTTGMFPINEFTSIGHESTTPSAEDAAHCSTESSSDEPPAVEVTSFKDFVVIQKSHRGVKTVPYLQRNSEYLLYDEHLKQRNEQNKAAAYKCRGCFTNHGSDDDPKASEAWIRCSNCKACYHESCAEEDGIYEWVYDGDGDNR